MLDVTEVCVEGFSGYSHAIDSPSVLLAQVVAVLRLVYDSFVGLLSFDGTHFFAEYLGHLEALVLVNGISFRSGRHIHPVRPVVDHVANVVALA